MSNPLLKELTKEQLIELIELYSKNWLAHDGVWFQSVEQKLGMDEAMHHDREAWRRFTVIEGKRIKAFLGLSDRPGLEGLEKALKFRFYGNLNTQSFSRENNTLIMKMVTCRVQDARSQKGMELHPCKSVGEIEYAGFARTIDDRISCRCLSCYPDITEGGCACAWEFTLGE
ncbi:MAG: hypothetical protein IJP23_01545 [Oscillospiraceae bacterium]|nr:hypothetical protein [Oscillospiraceae bacterium]